MILTCLVRDIGASLSLSLAVNSNVQVSGALPSGTLIDSTIVDFVDNDESIQSLDLFKHSAFIVIVKVSVLSLSLTSATTTCF